MPMETIGLDGAGGDNVFVGYNSGINSTNTINCSYLGSSAGENNTDGNQDYSNNLPLPDFVTSSNNHNALLQINSNIASDNNTIVNSHIINLNI